MKLVLWLTVIWTTLSLSNAFELKDTFREPKNILFGNVGGGSSHINWVISILEELANRGHNITFVTHVIYFFFVQGVIYSPLLSIG